MPNRENPTVTAARATVTADASFCPDTKAAGWAVWINVNWPDGRHMRIKKGGLFKERPPSSAWAEAQACWNGIFLAYGAGARDILVQNDCLSVVRGCGGFGHTMVNAYKGARETYWPDAVLAWRWVKGHTGGKCPQGGDNRRFFVNEWCDSEAKKYMRRQRHEFRQV